nr:hypothetical protein BaRGS_030883 [Batillaria attramentaria]
MKKVNPDCTKTDEVDNQTTDDHGYQGDVDRLNERVDDLDTRLRVIENLEHHAEVGRLQQELEEARKEIDNLMGAKADQSKLIKELQGKNADLAKLLTQKSEQLEKAKEKVEKLEKRINDMETENRCLRNGITRLQTQAQEADSTIKALKKTVAERSEKHEKDMMRMRSDKLRDRKAFDDFKKHVENQFQTLASQSPRDAQTPKSRGQNGTASNGKTQVTYKEITALLKLFAEFSGGNKQRLERTQFRDELCDRFQITDDFLMDRIFRAFDKGSKGYLRAEDFVCGMSTLIVGELEDKMKYTFQVYDLNSDGFISREEMFHLLKATLVKQSTEEDPDEGVKELVETALKKLAWELLRKKY